MPGENLRHIVVHQLAHATQVAQEEAAAQTVQAALRATVQAVRALRAKGMAS